MRYVLMVLGALVLAIGLLGFAKASNPDNNLYATVMVQLGGIFLAIAMATTDIVEAIKGSRRS
jgi:hypothetical protein